MKEIIYNSLIDCIPYFVDSEGQINGRASSLVLRGFVPDGLVQWECEQFEFRSLACPRPEWTWSHPALEGVGGPSRLEGEVGVPAVPKVPVWTEGR
jgi:hypothetical protein